ncbi:hypothetical protein TUM17576_09440 [Enterobacter hormaechei]|nr:hypothetical protein TUM17576_09440 [Enterobacter hormaechei]
MPNVKVYIYQMVILISGGEPTKVMVRAEREVTVVGTSVEMIDKV